MRLAKLLMLTFAYSISALPLVTLPWFRHISLDGVVGHLGHKSDLAEDRTIYQVLKDDDQYSRLVKVIDLSESVVDLLNDSSKSITFFALPNSVLPHNPHHGDHRHHESLVPFVAHDPSDVSYDLGDLVQQAKELDKEPESCDKDRRKEALTRIIHTIIAYHILPESYSTAKLMQSSISTYATNLTLSDGSMDSQPLRLSILSTLVPPRLKINMFAEVTKRDIKAKNGVIHQISHPLLPPSSIFQETFFVPEVFSIYTSAIQRVDLTGAIDRWQCSRDDGHSHFLGAVATTAFAPTFSAFKRLPKKLRVYLFSPFGQKALRKLLKYHIIPDFVLHTDYIHNSTSDATEFSRYLEGASEAQPPMPIPDVFGEGVEDFVFHSNFGPFPELVYEYKATLPTLLQDHHLRVHVARYKANLPIPGFTRYFTSFKVNGHRVGPFDIPARNGALHVLSTILNPRKGHDHHAASGDDEATWEDWEEWLPRWAMDD